MANYDSTNDTKDHIYAVARNIISVCDALQHRAEVHDASKFGEPEKSALDAIGKQSRTNLGSEEYQRRVKLLQPMLKHHYANNSHHPEHYDDGLSGMCLLDLLEMLCDWKAATEARDNRPFDIERSIEYIKEKHEIGDQLASILRNTAKRMGWSK